MEWLESLRDTRSPAPAGTAEKRKTYRVVCSLPVTVLSADDQVIMGQLINLSTTGLKLRFPRVLKPGTDYTFQVKGKPGPEQASAQQLTVQGRCVWCRRGPHGEGYEVGCLFTGFVGVHMDQVLEFFRHQLPIDEPAGDSTPAVAGDQAVG